MASLPRSLHSVFHQRSLRLPAALRLAVLSTRSQLVSPRAGTQFFSPPLLRQYLRPSNVLRVYARTSGRAYVGSDPVIRAVQMTKQPVLIYRAPNRQWYMVGVYALACGLVGASLWVLKFRYELPKDLPFFVGPTYVVVATIMLAIAGYIFSAPVARCQAIEVIPSTLGAGGVQLRIYARTVPFFKDKVIYARLGEVAINEKAMPVTQELIEADRARNQDVTEGLKDMFILPRLWEIAARLLDQKWTSFFLRFKFAVLRFGIVKLKVHGDTWKVDCQGYMLEDGLAIDRLIAQE